MSKKVELYKKLLTQETVTKYGLYKLSWEIHRDNVYKDYDYSSSKEFVEAEFTTISYETFTYMAHIGHIIEVYGITLAQAKEVGFTKLKEIAILAGAVTLSHKEMDEVIEMAKDMTVKEFQEYSKRERAKVKGEPEESTTFLLKFKVTEEQENIVAMALNIAMEKTETDDLAEALSYMATDFIASNSNKRRTKVKQKELIR